MATVNWGIIGCGDVCERKAGPALYGVAESRLVAVMRRDGARAADYARRHGVGRWYDSVDALLADPDVDTVYVATPDAAHAEMTIRAAEAGKHVLVEKAMALNAADCTRMIETCRRKNVTLAVAYYRRCYPSILRAHALIKEGAIGRVTRVRVNDEFPLSHRLDLLHFLCGDAAAVSATETLLPPGSHAVTGPLLRVRHLGGAVSETPVGWDECGTEETLDIEGDAGRIRIHDLKRGLITVHRSGQPNRREDVGPLPATHWGLIENFVRHRKGLAPLACDGVEGRKSTVILDIVEHLTRNPTETAEIPVSYA